MMQEPIRNSGAVSTDNQSKLYPKLKGFSIAQLNITSLTKHIDELRILITEMNFDILCINETRIDKTIKNSEIGLQGYDLTRRDRNRRGGGVAIYIRNTIPYVERSTIIPENVEAVCIEVRKPNAKPILISTWYRPPNSNSEILDSFEIFLQNIDKENKEIIITGDFNIDLMPSETENSKANRLKELLNTYQLSQLIKKPTRTTESTKTLLDLIICKTDDPKTATTDVVELGISDHNLVYTCRKVGICKQKPKIIETRQYHKLNSAKFQNDLKQALQHINEHSDPNTALQEWNRIFLLIADINAPTRLRKVRSDRQPWMTDEIKKLSFHRDYLKKKAVMLNSSSFHSSYKKCKNKVTKLISNAKTHYFRTNLENSKNCKENWIHINKLLNHKTVKTQTINNIKFGDQNITGDINIANTINNYFVEIGPKLASVISPTDIDPIQPIQPCRSEFNLRTITTTELIQTIGKTNLNKAPGLDKIPIKLIKLAGDAIHDSLLHIFNLVLGTGIFPDDLKLAKIIPIHKEGDKAECGNYRPISVIPTVAKILEKIIYDQLSSYINDNDIICKQQFGFRPNHSTETALLKCTDQWLLNMDKGMANGVLFLDLKKAFDTVDHSILLQKLYQYGIKGTPLKLLASYLNNRKQVCVINNNKSGQETVQCGVPQGSNLGPLLFSLYINDLPMCLEYTQASMFADDTNLTCTGRTPAEIEHKLNADLSNVNDWLEANRLTLNTGKTEFMLIASKRKLNQFRTDIRIHINGSIIKQVKQKKTLGITIDNELRWTEHINEQCKKLSSAIALLRKAKPHVPNNDLLRIYNSLVVPYFTYCSTVWNDGNKTNLEKLYKLQKRAARIITGLNYETRSKIILQSLGWNPIDNILKKREFLITFKAIRGIAPECICNMFSYCDNRSHHMRSNGRKLTLDKPNRSFMKKSFSYRGASAWNSLPNEILDVQEQLTIHSFKTKLNNHLR